MAEIHVTGFGITPDEGLTAQWHEDRPSGEYIAGAIVFPAEDWPPDIKTSVEVLREAIHAAIMKRIEAIDKRAHVGE